MTPEQLFHRHSDQADKVALDLCHFYAVSGAMAYQDEASSEARLALWKQAKKYDPQKQGMQKTLAEESYYAALIGFVVPEMKYKDPYETFWIYSLRRVRGAVLDFLRSEKLIFKLPKPEEGKDPPRTMLYYHRYVSLSRSISDVSASAGDNSGVDTFEDVLPSNSKTDAGDFMADIRSQVGKLRTGAQLSTEEAKILDLCFHEDEHSMRQVARLLKCPESRVKNLRDAALAKMRAHAVSANMLDANPCSR